MPGYTRRITDRPGLTAFSIPPARAEHSWVRESFVLVARALSGLGLSSTRGGAVTFPAVRFEVGEEHLGITCQECKADAVVSATGSAWWGDLRLGTVATSRCTACGCSDSYPERGPRFP